MRGGPDGAQKRRGPILGVVAIALWVVAVALATAVFVLIGNLPHDTAARTHRALMIAAGAFITFAIPATAMTIVALVVGRGTAERSSR
jgi:hypothetical protein